MREWRYSSIIFYLCITDQFHAPSAVAPRKEPPGTHWIEGWVGPTRLCRIDKIILPLREPNLGRPLGGLSLCRLSYQGSYL
jgi:hypothetical protein